MGWFDFLLPYKIERDRPYGSNSRQKLDLFTPKSGVTSETKVVVFFYGGGFQTGSKADYEFVADTLARQGFIVVIPDYRLWSRSNPSRHQWPTQIQDGVSVVGWCRANLRTSTGARPVCLIGHSAGGIIAKHLVFDEQWLGERVRGAVGMAGASDFDALNRPDLLPWDYFPVGSEATRNVTAHVDGSELPILLQHGLADTVEPPSQTELLEAAIVAAGGAVAPKYYAGLDHTGLIAGLHRLTQRADVRNDIIDWLRAA